MNIIQTEILMGIAIAIFLLFIYTLFFFNWSKDIKFWSKQKQIHNILKPCITKNQSTKNNNKINTAYNSIKNLFKDYSGECQLNKMHNTLTKMQKGKDCGDNYLIKSLLSKMETERKYCKVSNNFQILFKKIDTQISVINNEELTDNITALYNKIGEKELEVISSKKGYWVGVIGIVISVLIYVLPKLFNL